MEYIGCPGIDYRLVRNRYSAFVMKSILKAALLVVGFIVLLLLVMALSPLWDRPPEPTTRTVRAEDLAGTYHYPLKLEIGQAILHLKQEGTFTQVLTPTNGQPSFTVDGRWDVVGAKLILDGLWSSNFSISTDQLSQPLETLGQKKVYWWRIIDSYANKKSFQLFGGDTGPEEDNLILDRN